MDTKKDSHDPLPARTEQVATQIVDAAFKVHSSLGPGLLESLYQACVVHELKKRGLKVGQQIRIPIIYEDLRIEAGFRLDLLVEDCVIVELKAAEKLLPVFEAQLLTYLKLSEKRLGILINFNVSRI